MKRLIQHNPNHIIRTDTEQLILIPGFGMTQIVILSVSISNLQIASRVTTNRYSR